MVMYTPEDKQITFCGMNRGSRDLTVYDLIKNPIQQKGFNISADEIPSFDRNFLVTTLGY